jgi:lysophospholipase L1-like esterase
VSNQINYVSTPGNHADDASADAFRQRFTQFAWVTGLQVEAPSSSAVAAIGDSITDGMRSSINQNRRWPDAFARKVAQSGGGTTAVINLGISGNRLLSDSPCYGDALETRFGRDVLAQPGVKAVILLIGINDINFASMPARGGLDCDFPHTAVSAESLIAGYRHVIATAHSRGLRIFGATLTPADLPPQREAIRSAVNQWIRTGHAFDGVVDFDAALRDPAQPTHLQRAFDSGDHIHPSDAGYSAMADAIPLSAVLGAAKK